MVRNRIRSFILLVAGTFIFTFSHGIVGECHNLPETSYTPVEGTILMRGPGITDEEAVNDIMSYQSLPASIQNMLVANNIHIYELNAENGDTVSQKTSAAYTTKVNVGGRSFAAVYQTYRYGDGSRSVSVLANGYIDLDSKRINTLADHGRHTLIHEVAHQMDYLYLGGYPVTAAFYNASSQPEWQQIYAAEQNKIGSYSRAASYNVYNTAEAFAEAGSLYLTDPVWLQTNCPLSYAYLEKVMNWYNQMY